MPAFMDENFLLYSKEAQTLYHEHGAKMPLIDYHCHIDPKEIAEDVHHKDIAWLWLGGKLPSGGYFGDHYKWRLMRSAGVPESYITGDKTAEEKFIAWATALQGAVGNPLYHWTHLELQRYFDVKEPLTKDNAARIYKHCNEILACEDMSVRGILKKSRVKLLCTTDDPADDLSAHEKIAADPTCPSKVLPAFRPDKAMLLMAAEFPAYVDKLEKAVGFPIDSMDAMRRALLERIDYFDKRGCRVSDHALEYVFYVPATETQLNDSFCRARMGLPISHREYEAYHSALLLCCAQAYREKDWVMQLHFGCIRNNSKTMFDRLGADTGFDAMNEGTTAAGLSALLNALEENNALPRTVLYSLNPADNGIIATVMGCFQTDSAVPGKIQIGSAWWFNDHLTGMEQQLTDLMNLGYLGGFVGMLTDSRSFLSYPRHEYFRRILCNKLGELVNKGQYPWDEGFLGQLVENICYNNALKYFRFDEVIK